MDGFAVMDVSTSLHDDPKVKRLAREFPEQLGTGFLAYVATMGESWKAGQRLSVLESWPAHLPFDAAAVEALKAVKLLEQTGQVTASAWRGYFMQARKRRKTARDRWDRANKARRKKEAESNGNDNAVTARSHRGHRAATAAIRTSDSVNPTEGDSTPPTPSPARGHRNGRAKPAPGLTDYDALMQRDDDEESIAWMRDQAEPVKS